MTQKQYYLLNFLSSQLSVTVQDVAEKQLLGEMMSLWRLGYLTVGGRDWERRKVRKNKITSHSLDILLTPSGRYIRKEVRRGLEDKSLQFVLFETRDQ